MKSSAFFLTILLALASVGANAQNNKFNATTEESDDDTYQSPFSIKIGYNISDVIMSPEPMNLVSSKKSFHVGLVAGETKIGRGISIRPELLYSLQGFSVASVGKVGLHYISLPLLAKLNMGHNTSLLLGPQISYLANARIGVVSDLFSVNYDGMFQKWDASLVTGAEYKLNSKASIGGRYLYGLNNINKDFDIGNAQFNEYFQLKNSTAQFYVTLKF